MTQTMTLTPPSPPRHAVPAPRRVLRGRPTLEALRPVLADSPLIVLDGGARNGTFETPNLAPYTHVYGFEPNNEEYQKLLTGKTDLYKACGEKTPKYAKVIWCPAALADTDGRRTLHITKGPGACSLMRPNFRLINTYATTYAEVFEIIRTETVDCSTLATVLQRYQIDEVDYIKLDTQGNEYEILFADPAVLERISVIKSEVELIQTYEGQRLFHDMDGALRQTGYHFVDFLIGPEKRIGRNQLVTPRGINELLWADAYWARTLHVEERRENPLRAFKQALVLMDLGYIEYGLYLLTLLDPHELPVEAVRAYYASDRRPLKRFIPASIKTAIKRIYRRLAGLT